jgi:hypothetical protein
MAGSECHASSRKAKRIDNVKRLFLALLFFFFFSWTTTAAHAQDESPLLEWLTVDLWPDFDRPSVLVLLTASINQDTTLPVTVRIPRPEEATLNAVARITDDNEMIDDLTYSEGEDALVVEATERRIRIEYYVPYEADGLERQFTFNWVAESTGVGELDVSVQEPAAATSLATDPAAAPAVTGNDGLRYYNLPTESVPAGEPYAVTVSYTMGSAQLTTAMASTAAPAAGDVDSPAAAETGGLSALNWPVILGAVGGILLLLALGWQLFGGRLSSRSVGRTPRKPAPQRTPGRAATPTGGATAPYCHECGEPSRPGDRFCRNCGTQLKNSG